MDNETSHPFSLLFPPPADEANPLQQWWSRPRSLTEWVQELGQIATDVSGAPAPVEGETLIAAPAPIDSISSLTPLQSTATPEFLRASTELFYAHQRARWVARKAFNKWRTRVWRKRPQCGVDLIMNEPVAPRDAIYLTDTRNRAIYCFHRRDLFTNLMTKITAAEEMLPTPRPPTNPWTNQPLTLAQTIAVCQALLQDSVARGRCPPTLFAAFCAARYDLPRFESENSSLLAQYAINSYFTDIHDHNREVVVDTALELLRDSGVNYSAVAFRRWMRTGSTSLIHREWLSLVRDYTLHMNLHIQSRRHWYTDAAIYTDVRALYRRTPVGEPAGPRLRMLRNGLSIHVGPQVITPATAPTTATLSTIPSPLSMAVLHLAGLASDTTLTAPIAPTAPTAATTDASGNANTSTTTDTDEADALSALLMLLQGTNLYQYE